MGSYSAGEPETNVTSESEPRTGISDRRRVTGQIDRWKSKEVDLQMVDG